MEDDHEGVQFFISYASDDRDWAVWIAVQLEAVDYTTRYQAADFRPGRDFLHEMQEAITSAERMIAVLSPAYLKSRFSAAEWRAVFARDLTGELGLLIPVRVRRCEPPGLLVSRVYVDLVDAEEEAARRKLLAAVDRNRPRATTAPFPGRPPASGVAPFPAAGRAAQNAAVRSPTWIHPLPGFVPPRVTGREQVLRDLTEALQQPGTVLAALVGNAGIGKTAVAAKFAREQDDDYAVDYLAARGYPALTAGSVLAGIAQAHPDAEVRAALLDRLRDRDLSMLAKLDAVLDVLGGRRVLLILDDVEQLLDDDDGLRDETLLALLEDLSVRQRHGVKVLLLTTRCPRSPTVVSVEMLDGLPVEEFREFLSDLASATGTALLPMPPLQWALFTGATRTWPRPAERIHGIAAGAPATLQRVLDTMANGRALGEITADVLGDAEREVVRTLAVYGRPVSREAVAELVGEQFRDRVGEVLSRLADRLVVRREAGGSEKERFVLPVAERSDFLPADTGVVADLRARAARYFYRLARASEAFGRLRDLADLEPYLDAIELYLDCGDGERALRVMKDINDRYLTGWGQTGVLLVHLRRLSRMLTDTHAQVLADSLVGRALMQQGRPEEAVELIVRAGRRNATLKDNETQLILLNQLGGAYFAQGRVGMAIDTYQEAIELADSGRELWSRADARYNVAICLVELGEFEAAMRSIARARRDLEEVSRGAATGGTDDVDNERLAARLLFAEAKIALERGNYVTSAALAERARGDARDLGAEILAGRCDDLRAWALLLDRDETGAMVAAQAAHRVAAETSHPDLLRISGTTLALLHLRRGDIADAYAAADLAVRSSHSMPGAGAFAMRGIVEWRRRRARPAEEDFLRGLSIVRGTPDSEPELYEVLDFTALKQAGLALVRHSAPEEERALATYRSAIAHADLPGVRARRRSLFRELVADDRDALPRLRALLQVTDRRD